MSQCQGLTILGSRCTRQAKENNVCGMHAKTNCKSMLFGFEQDNVFTVNDLNDYYQLFQSQGYGCELVNLNSVLPYYDNRLTQEAAILIVRQFNTHGIDRLEDLNWNKQMILRKKLVNRRDKYTLEFDCDNCDHCDDKEDKDKEDKDKEDNGKDDKPININTVPILMSLKAKIDDFTKECHKINGSYFFNNQSGFKYHADLVNNVYVNFNTTVLYFQWFLNRKPIADVIKVELNDDLVIMSENVLGIEAKKGIPIIKYAIGDKYK